MFSRLKIWFQRERLWRRLWKERAWCSDRLPTPEEMQVLMKKYPEDVKPLKRPRVTGKLDEENWEELLNTPPGNLRWTPDRKRLFLLLEPPKAEELEKFLSPSSPPKVMMGVDPATPGGRDETAFVVRDEKGTRVFVNPQMATEPLPGVTPTGWLFDQKKWKPSKDPFWTKEMEESKEAQIESWMDSLTGPQPIIPTPSPEESEPTSLTECPRCKVEWRRPIEWPQVSDCPRCEALHKGSHPTKCSVCEKTFPLKWDQDHRMCSKECLKSWIAGLGEWKENPR